MKKRVALVSLGCAKNLVDSEEMLAMFPPEKFDLTSDPSSADLILVNTCGFIESAKRESIQAILDMAQYKKRAKLVVTGCLATRYAKQLEEEIPEADLIVPLKDYPKLAEKLGELLGESGIEKMNPLRRTLSTSSYSAYLRISDGCDNFCSFCAIPHIRGRFVSRPYEEIMEEARGLAKKGVKEISLISQDTTVYGIDHPEWGKDIVSLLKDLESLGFYSIRLLYLYPSEIKDELIETIAQSKVIAHYFDIPVQCASDHLLTLMKRHADAQETRDLFKKIRKMCPDAILRTTLISGFPGENEEDQKETLDFLSEVEFDKMGCFLYSREEGTAAYSLPGQVEEKVKERRKDELMKLQAKISYKKAKEHVGETMEGIVVGEQGGSYLLRSYWNAPDDIDGNILFSTPKDHNEGEIVKVKITQALVYDLLGEEVE